MCPVIFLSVAHPSWAGIFDTLFVKSSPQTTCSEIPMKPVGGGGKTVESESIVVESREYVLLTCLLGNTYAGGKAWKILVYKSWLRFSNSLNLFFYFQYTW